MGGKGRLGHCFVGLAAGFKVDNAPCGPKIQALRSGSHLRRAS
jgi:hypothetical protein